MKQKFMKILAVAAIAFLATTAGTIRAGDYLYMYATNGTTQSLAFNDLRKLTFTEQGINVHLTDNKLSTLPYNNVSVITFNPNGATAISEIVANALKVYRNETGTVIIESPTEISVVHLYNIQGALLQQFAPKSLSASLPLSNFPTGLYIIRIIDRQRQVTTHKIINP